MNSMVKSLHNAGSLPSGSLSNSHDRGKSAFIQYLARIIMMNYNFEKNTQYYSKLYFFCYIIALLNVK